jgi:hypothetical protein
MRIWYSVLGLKRELIDGCCDSILCFACFKECGNMMDQAVIRLQDFDESRQVCFAYQTLPPLRLRR